MNPTENPSGKKFGLASFTVAFAILVFVGWNYWPLHQAWFVWDDKILIHDNAWLSVGDGWKKVVLHGISDWRYFRPLGLALLIAETRLFGVVPGPMHVVSVALHLCDTVLVGALAWQLARRNTGGMASGRWVFACMLIYGLHPALVEPVAWIASQFDLLVTLFVLLGLLLNFLVRDVLVRALTVTTCFFAAACAKETAIAFPVLLFLMDWVQPGGTVATVGLADVFRSNLRRQWPVYLGVLAAGAVYLVLRAWARSDAPPSEYETFLSWQRLQTICFCYMVYWRMIVWPFVGISPDHIIEGVRFATTDASSLAVDFAAIAISSTGIHLAWRRKPLGILIVGFGATLFPVLHVLPVYYDESLYHERYVMPAIAFACSLLPLLQPIAPMAAQTRFRASMALTAVLSVWLLLATFTVRTTVPLWFNDALVWQWALKANPDSIFVMNNLMSTYLANRDLDRAEPIAGAMLVKGRSCADCMMNVTSLALLRGDGKRAAEDLKLTDLAFRHTSPTHSRVISYVMLNGEVHLLDNDKAGAEAAFRDAISIDPERPSGYFFLSQVLACEGRPDEAKKVFAQAAGLSAPDAIPAYRATFDAVLAACTKKTIVH